MVEVKYNGRRGNNLFQYCFGRIIAEKLGYKLKADPVPGFQNTKERIEGQDYSSGYPTQVIAHDSPEIYPGDYSEVLSWKNKNLDLQRITADRSERKVVLIGYFQRYEYYKDYKDTIRKNWLLVNGHSNERIYADDIVVHIRCGDDYARDPIGAGMLPLSYYEECLKIAGHKRIFVCTDDPRNPFVRLFYKRHKSVILHEPNDPAADFCFIMSFNKIIISASSFGWWAAFLSGAREIYAPVPLSGYWSSKHPEVNLKVDDEERYIYIPCKDIYKKTFYDRCLSAKDKLVRKIGVK